MEEMAEHPVAVVVVEVLVGPEEMLLLLVVLAELENLHLFLDHQ
jgi:hypothetical protein